MLPEFSMFQDMNAVVLYCTDTGDGGYSIQDNTNYYVLKTEWEIALTQEIISDRSTFLSMTSSLFPAVYLCVRQYKQKRFLI